MTLTVIPFEPKPQRIRDPYGHPAVRLACELWDEPRDLMPCEEAFLLAVRQAGQDHTATCGAANREFGPDSKAALAVEFLAKQRRAERYTEALNAYNEAKQQEDEQ